MEYILQNPLILVALILVVMVGLAYIIVKPRKKQAKKDDKKPESESETKAPDDVAADANVTASESEDKPKKKKKKLRKLKPEITHVYEKKKLKSKEEQPEEKQEDLSPIEEEFLKRMQFVKTSKNISKLKPYTVKEEIVEEHIEELTMPETEEKCVFCEESHKSSYFDRSRRLSKMIKDGTFDDMFCSHISEKYMNIDDISRHIRNCDEIEEKLFERAAKRMANSEAKLSISEEGKVQKRSSKDDVMALSEERKRQEIAKFVTSKNEEYQVGDYDYEDIVHDDVDLSARNILVVDSILNRKGKTKPKK
ncbi:MAG: hypothetical protein IKD36_01120 [Clostridia bacterium]|nr:hypothetical protein [Clostridia bacterium]